MRSRSSTAINDDTRRDGRWLEGRRLTECLALYWLALVDVGHGKGRSKVVAGPCCKRGVQLKEGDGCMGSWVVRRRTGMELMVGGVALGPGAQRKKGTAAMFGALAMPWGEQGCAAGVTTMGVGVIGWRGSNCRGLTMKVGADGGSRQW